MPEMSLIDFLIKFHKTPGWQQLYKAGGTPWKNLVNRELSDDDAAIVLSENQGAIEAKVAEQKTSVHIVWLNSTVWVE
jgi:hypothetical protein